MKEISLIIVNRNVRQYLKDCLESVFRCWEGPGETLEVIVVDNGSCDGSPEMVRESFPAVQVIANHKNVGFASACNMGIAAAHGRRVLLLNPDTRVLNGLYGELTAFMDTNPKAGIIGPLVMNPDGSRQPTYRRFPTYSNIIFSRKSPISRLWPGNKGSRDYLQGDVVTDRPSRVEALGGACMLLSREMLDQVGALDENYFMYLEDTDLCYRAAQNGWETWLVPSAKIIHHWGASSSQEAERSADEHRRSVYYYFVKHHSPGLLRKAYIKAGLMVHKLMG
jgi:hypothetical protein